MKACGHIVIWTPGACDVRKLEQIPVGFPLPPLAPAHPPILTAEQMQEFLVATVQSLGGAPLLLMSKTAWFLPRRSAATWFAIADAVRAGGRAVAQSRLELRARTLHLEDVADVWLSIADAVRSMAGSIGLDVAATGTNADRLLRARIMRDALVPAVHMADVARASLEDARVALESALAAHDITKGTGT